jgi:hypothetical protein
MPLAAPLARLVAFVIVASSLAHPARAQATAGRGAGPTQGEWAAVDKALGRPGIAQAGEVQKYSFPRADLTVTLSGVTIKPALALGSWVAFKRTAGAGQAMAMGDLVLTQDEVMPVVTKLQSMGVEQTALHNHLERESPVVMYLHIQAQGDPVRIADAVHAALGLTRTPPMPKPPASAPAFELDSARLRSALGYSGKVNGGVYQVSVPRAEPVRAAGMEIPPSMGVATALNFQPTGQGNAAVTGDFVLVADEVNPVIRTLAAGGIAVTALHSHMLQEEPRLFFMHFWANSDAVRLAGTLHQALSHMKVRTSTSS